MIIGIDASNIKAGGGIQHLLNLINYADPIRHGFTKIIIWGGDNPLDLLEDRDWLVVEKLSILNKNIFFRLYWQTVNLTSTAKKNNCNVLFVPGGIFLGKFRPFVTMFQNMQVFQIDELIREKYSLSLLRLIILNLLQSFTFKNCSGLVCLSLFSINYLKSNYWYLIKNIKMRLIPHGRQQFSHEKHNISFIGAHKLLYVSTVKAYKHHSNVIKAVSSLVNEGFDVQLHLVGAADKSSLVKMNIAISQSPANTIFYHGNLCHEKVINMYRDCDIFVFASSCETFGIALLEAMSAGMPIACSNRPPLPEMLGEGGVYFDPEDVESILASLRFLLSSSTARETLASKSLLRSELFDWQHTADSTFSFLKSSIAN